HERGELITAMLRLVCTVYLVEKRKYKSHKGCRLSVDAIPSVLQSFDEQKPPVRMLIMMMFCHGSRIGETRKARWSNISFTRKQWLWQVNGHIWFVAMRLDRPVGLGIYTQRLK
ncbi:hypothetical protein L4D78_19690, partial [Photobacterium minamisatsumaniensis]